MSSVALFLILASLVWLSAFILLLVFALRHARSPLVQEITGILSNTPSSQQHPSDSLVHQPGSRDNTTNHRPAGETLETASVAPGPYQQKLTVLGAYLDRHQRQFIVIWELANGYLLQTAHSGSARIDYLKVSQRQLDSLAGSPPMAGVQGPAASLLQHIGAHLDRRRAVTIQLVVTDGRVVAGGLEPVAAGQPDTAYHSDMSYKSFQQVFPAPTAVH